jgi:hypothetical protein
VEASETFNKFFVGMRGDQIQIMKSPAVLSKADALNLAGWLVALADFSPDHAEFHALLKEIESA